MSPKPETRNGDDMLPEYDFSNAVRGKYYERYRQGTNVVLLDPDVAEGRAQRRLAAERQGVGGQADFLKRQMAKLGTAKRPAVVHVRTMDRAEEIVSVCDRHGWKVIVGIESDEPEDIWDVEALLTGERRRSVTVASAPSVGRNDPCPCGSGGKFKKCCGRS